MNDKKEFFDILFENLFPNIFSKLKKTKVNKTSALDKMLIVKVTIEYTYIYENQTRFELMDKSNEELKEILNEKTFLLENAFKLGEYKPNIVKVEKMSKEEKYKRFKKP